MSISQANDIANELGLSLTILSNGLLLKRGNQIVKLFKHTWHYNMGTYGKKWERFNGTHEEVVRFIFKVIK